MHVERSNSDGLCISRKLQLVYFSSWHNIPLHWNNILKMTTQSPVLLWKFFMVSLTQENLFLCLTSSLHNLPLSDTAHWES